MLEALEIAAINADTDISNEAVGRLIGPAARFKCEMRFTVPFESNLEAIYRAAFLAGDRLSEAGRISGHDFFFAWAQELALEAAYISWYGREGTP